MDNYNFAADLLATFRASPDFVKALWLLVPPGFIIGLVIALKLRTTDPDGQIEILPPSSEQPRQGAHPDLLTKTPAPAIQHLLQEMPEIKRS